MREIRKEPCGNCDCGTYSEFAMLNKKARTFGAINENKRVEAIPRCKKDKKVKCCGYYHHHLALIEIDKYTLES